MKAITLWQPWASLCVEPRLCPADTDGDGSCANRLCDEHHRLPWKSIETRHWPAPTSLIGQTIAIHAAKRKPDYMQLGGLMVVQDEDGWWIDDGSNPPNFRPVPLGEIVGTVRLAACVEMTDRYTVGNPHLFVDGETLWLAKPVPMLQDQPRVSELVDVTDQRPFGLFEPGRYAWIFTDAVRFDEPIPVTGRQGIWTWT